MIINRICFSQSLLGESKTIFPIIAFPVIRIAQSHEIFYKYTQHVLISITMKHFSASRNAAALNSQSNRDRISANIASH